MPTRRGSEELCDLIDDHGAELRELMRVVRVVTSDSQVTPVERRLLHLHMQRAAKTFRPLPARGSEVDGALMCIGAIAGAGRISRYVKSKVNQAAADSERMAEPVALALLRGGAFEDGPEAA